MKNKETARKAKISVSPRVDLVFKKIFGIDQNKDLLISLINSIVDEKDKIKDVTIKNPYNLREFKKAKESVLDIKATGCNDQTYNIEMQVIHEANYDKRALYYWAKLYSQQLMKGGDYGTLKRTIGIHILNFPFVEDGKEKYHKTFHVTEKDLGTRFFTDMEIHTIELPVFEQIHEKLLNSEIKQPEVYNHEMKTKLDKWSTWFTRNEFFLDKSGINLFNDPDITKASEIVEEISFTEQERLLYEERLSWMRLEASGLKMAKLEGIILGRKEGIAIGEVKGEKNKQIEIAKKMLSDKLDLDLISRYSGLTIKEIENLINV